MYIIGWLHKSVYVVYIMHLAIKVCAFKCFSLLLANLKYYLRYFPRRTFFTFTPELVSSAFRVP